MTTTEISREDAEEAKPQLPDGWCLVRIEDVVTPYNAYWGTEEPFPNSTEALVLGVGNITNEGNIKLDGAQKRYLSPNETEGIALEGDLLIVKSSGSATNIRSGKTGLCPAELSGKIACSNFMIRLVVNREVAEPYLLWLILNSEAAKAFVRLIAGSTTYPNIKWSSYKDFSFSLPALAEQKRIAGILKEQMASVERARRSAEAQLQAAKSLPAAYLRAVFNSPEAQAWPRKRLESVCREIYRYPSFYGMEHPPKGVPVIRGEHINGSGEISTNWDDYWFVSSEVSANFPRTILDEGDLVFTVRGTIGKIGIVRRSHQGAQISPNLIRIAPSSEIHAPYLWLFFQAVKDGDDAVEDNAVTVATVKAGDLADLEIPIPSTSDQRRIAAQLSAQMASVERLRQRLAEQLDAIHKLPAALLREAFSGRV